MIKKLLVALAVAGGALSAHAAVLLNQGFNNVAGLAVAGWVFSNLSSPVGSTGWFQGQSRSDTFDAQAGGVNSFIAANYNNSTDGGTINDYLITPTFNTSTTVIVSFFANASKDLLYSDNIAFGFSSGTGTAVGGFSFSPVAPVAQGIWTNYTTTIASNGLGSTGRFAIRYTGPADTSNYVGIDSLSVTQVPEPSTIMIFGAGMLGLLVLRRRKQI